MYISIRVCDTNLDHKVWSILKLVSRNLTYEATPDPARSCFLCCCYLRCAINFLCLQSLSTLKKIPISACMVDYGGHVKKNICISKVIHVTEMTSHILPAPTTKTGCTNPNNRLFQWCNILPELCWLTDLQVLISQQCIVCVLPYV